MGNAILVAVPFGVLGVLLLVAFWMLLMRPDDSESDGDRQMRMARQDAEREFRRMVLASLNPQIELLEELKEWIRRDFVDGAGRPWMPPHLYDMVDRSIDKFGERLLKRMESA